MTPNQIYASKRPPKCCDCSGNNYQPVGHRIVRLITPFYNRNSVNSCSSRAALTKLVPWTLHIVDGFPRRATNHLSVEMKASIVRSETSSRCAAFSENETNMQMHASTTTGVCIQSYLTSIIHTNIFKDGVRKCQFTRKLAKHLRIWSFQQIRHTDLTVLCDPIT